MSIYLKPGKLKEKDENGNYLGLNIFAEKSVAEVLESIPDDYTELANKVEQFPGISDDAREALLACFRNVVWKVSDGQDYYNTLYTALYDKEPEPEPEIPDTYIRYDYIGMKNASEVPSAYIYPNSPHQAGLSNANGVIATTVYPDLNALSFETAFREITTPTKDLWLCLFGGRSQSGSAYSQAVYLHSMLSSVRAFAHGVDLTITHSYSVNEKCTIKLENPASSPSIFSINNHSENIGWTNTNVVNSPIYLFTNSTYGSTGEQYVSTNLHIGELKIKDTSGNLVSNWVPVKRKEDGVIGIYDTVQKVFQTTTASEYATESNAKCIYVVGNW